VYVESVHNRHSEFARRFSRQVLLRFSNGPIRYSASSARPVLLTLSTTPGDEYRAEDYWGKN
jgi:hypothetical protein